MRKGKIVLALAAALFFLPPPLLAQSPSAGAFGIPAWGIRSTELVADPSVLFGVLPNGMRYAIQKNHNPKEGASIRFTIDAGKRDERTDEAGAAHFVEHMAFNGSAHIPEGEFFPRLERLGLATGKDSNAETGVEHTTYKFDLPKATPETLCSTLDMVREIASELALAPDAVARERGVILSEVQMRSDGRRPRSPDSQDGLTQDNPIATQPDLEESLGSITAEKLREFYEAYYRPERATLVVVGDIDPSAVESWIKARFSDWAGKGKTRGPNIQAAASSTDIHISASADSKGAEVVEMLAVKPYHPPLNTVADEERGILQAVATLAMNGRLAAVARKPESPVIGGRMMFQKLYRTTENDGIVVLAREGRMLEALATAEQEMRRAKEFGFTQMEVKEAKANIEALLQRAVASSDSMTNSARATALSQAALNGKVPFSPGQNLDLYSSLASKITPAAVSQAFSVAWANGPNVVRVSTKSPIDGGKMRIALALAESAKVPLAAETENGTAQFAYDYFGPAGTIVADRRVADLGIREVEFANGVHLNLKKTDFEPGRIALEVRVGDGLQSFPKDRPALGPMVALVMQQDGLKAHDAETLRHLLAGHGVTLVVRATQDALIESTSIAPSDLELQFKLFAARLVASGFRPETQARWAAEAPTLAEAIRRNVTQFAAGRLDYVLTSNDGRFGIADAKDFEQRSLSELREALEPQLMHGAVNVGLVGDFDEEKAISAVATTLGALPRRDRASNRFSAPTIFPSDLTTRTIYHDGSATQGVVTLNWRTTDFHDQRSSLIRHVLASVIRLKLLEILREKLAIAYSPSAVSIESPVANGFGHLTVTIAGAPEKIDELVEATLHIAADLRTTPISDDLLLRARLPIIDDLNQKMSQNAGWIDVVTQSQNAPEKLDQQRRRLDILKSISSADVQAAAKAFLSVEPLQVRFLPSHNAAAKKMK